MGSDLPSFCDAITLAVRLFGSSIGCGGSGEVDCPTLSQEWDDFAGSPAACVESASL